MKIIFMGTPQFAVPILEKINKKHDIILVVTQPDNLNRKKIIFSPVKQFAINNNLQVFQPQNINIENEILFKESADLIVTAAYGQFIGHKILNFPKYGCINVHGSILPKYRGGAPIQRSIINGDKKSGITILYMDKKMDAGDIITQREIEINDLDTQDSLFNKLSILGSELILDVISNIEHGNIIRVKQDESKVSFAYNLTSKDLIIDFNRSALDIYNQIRGLNSNPGAYFVHKGKIYKIYASKLSDLKHNRKSGTILNADKNNLIIACDNGSSISILEIQPESKRKMNIKSFLNGNGRNFFIKNEIIGE
ncbi:MAG: methionyl-tRNA formyltransferase [Bacilli bacterium]|nr:methionyl-tRNA formyltransferase [Bacilli bacterium]MDD3121233.1 methionyl-tRNA formyltransferase [Bacilli bacterium]MDD4062874.1 methionyl-tRNA formyltransferase [Bacilli bacterium]MDD4481925.1 methionyl-tRNA formyltransferase [Bacilli bacterium]MDD5182923.1 methionyl-tRNA formyltransferase [Bacilli bacterium]